MTLDHGDGLRIDVRYRDHSALPLADKAVSVRRTLPDDRGGPSFGVNCQTA